MLRGPQVLTLICCQHFQVWGHQEHWVHQLDKVVGCQVSQEHHQDFPCRLCHLEDSQEGHQADDRVDHQADRQEGHQEGQHGLQAGHPGYRHLLIGCPSLRHHSRQGKVDVIRTSMAAWGKPQIHLQP